ncbi:MAG TPA: hypothetical protein VF119_09885 [Candidatus Limnocylindrales bacterium]
MTTPNGRADDRLAAWTAATDRPTPSFRRGPTKRGGRLRPVLLVLVVIVLLGAAVGTFVVVGGRGRSGETASPADLTTGAIQALATAPGIEYRMSLGVDYGGGDRQGIDSTGTVDYTTGRFSGTADSGGGPFMLLFGGPRSGAVVIADGRFVKTEDGPWEQVEDVPTPFDRLLDRSAFSTALRLGLEGARFDPAIGSVPCQAAACRSVTMIVPPAGFAAVMRSLFGESATAIPADLTPIGVVLHIDAESGFLRHLEARGTAGTSVTVVTLDLARLDQPPSIVRPIP